jgi:hypothetical protein
VAVAVVFVVHGSWPEIRDQARRFMEKGELKNAVPIAIGSGMRTEKGSFLIEVG